MSPDLSCAADLAALREARGMKLLMVSQLAGKAAELLCSWCKASESLHPK